MQRVKEIFWLAAAIIALPLLIKVAVFLFGVAVAAYAIMLALAIPVFIVAGTILLFGFIVDVLDGLFSRGDKDTRESVETL